MRRIINCFLKISLLGMIALIAVPALADDWPQWRGPNRDGVWLETGVIE